MGGLGQREGIVIGTEVFKKQLYTPVRSGKADVIQETVPAVAGSTAMGFGSRGERLGSL